ncbi:MAG: ATP-binding protein [Sphingomonas sp.]
MLKGTLDHYHLGCLPPIGHGGLDDARVLSNNGPESLDSVLEEVAGLETASVEFKSSFQVDLKRKQFDPGKVIGEYRSETVLLSALKSIAAFANAEGGTLYLGVEDDGTICGLADDFVIANPKRSDFDGWDQAFRNLIRSRFSDGGALLSYISGGVFVSPEGLHFVRLRVARRSRLTFVKSDENWFLFVRTGTQTNSIPYPDIEQHFEMRRLY